PESRGINGNEEMPTAALARSRRDRLLELAADQRPYHRPRQQSDRESQRESLVTAKRGQRAVERRLRVNGGISLPVDGDPGWNRRAAVVCDAHVPYRRCAGGEIDDDRVLPGDRKAQGERICAKQRVDAAGGMH